VLDHGRLVAHGTAEELKRRVPGGHVALRFADATALDGAAGALGPVARDDAALTLRVPGDGSVAGLRDLLGRLDAAGVEVDRLSLHTPDLDDVFLALTGRPQKDRTEQDRTEQVTA
jgi:ABC-2 type transport system ATP-binding protein